MTNHNATLERPILFSAPMVRAILDGKKTQTRRVVKLPAHFGIDHDHFQLETKSGLGWIRHDCIDWETDQARTRQMTCPYGQPGDRLWVRETWQYADWTEDGEPYIGYAADNRHRLCADSPIEWADRLTDTWAELSDPANYDIDQRAADRRWRPSIHMPRWASRITLEITGVRVERLLDISEDDALAEGIVNHRLARNYYAVPGMGDGHYLATAREAFEALWSSISGQGSWDANPWVWVVEFRRLP